jgi:aconitate hydratase
MGILPLQFAVGESPRSLGLTGHEVYDIPDVAADGLRETTVRATPPEGDPVEFDVTVRIDTPQEWHYFRHGGILQYVLRQLLRSPNGS